MIAKPAEKISEMITGRESPDFFKGLYALGQIIRTGREIQKILLLLPTTSSIEVHFLLYMSRFPCGPNLFLRATGRTQSQRFSLSSPFIQSWCAGSITHTIFHSRFDLEHLTQSWLSNGLGLGKSKRLTT